MGGGAFADRERLNLNSRKSKKSADSKKQKTEKSPEQNLHLEKNLTSKKSEKDFRKKNLKFSKIALRNFQKNRNSKTFQKFIARKNLLKKFLNQKFYRLHFFQKFHSRFFENSGGTILIEFAFCVPVLILLLLYINDIMILARTQDEMKRATYCAVQLIQNVSKNRPIENRKITKKDIKNIARAWTIMVPCVQKALKIGEIHIVTTLMLVEGTAKNTCVVKWVYSVVFGNRSNEIKWGEGSFSNGSVCNWDCVSFSNVHGKSGKTNQSLNSADLYPDLHIEQGKTKVILEIAFEDLNKSNFKGAEMLGLRMLKGLKKSLQGGVGHISLLTHIIFKPINGIFDETTPPQ